jgi:hypothetical protein
MELLTSEREKVWFNLHVFRNLGSRLPKKIADFVVALMYEAIYFRTLIESN